MLSKLIITLVVGGILAVLGIVVTAGLFAYSFLMASPAQAVETPIPFITIEATPISSVPLPTETATQTVEGVGVVPTTAATGDAPATAVPTAAPTAIAAVNTSVKYVLALADVNIRSGPGTNYSIMGWVSGGQIAAVTGVSPDNYWWQVSCPNGQNGSCWVTAGTQYTQPTTAPNANQPTATPAATPTSVAAVNTSVQYILALADVNIRSGPGTNYSIVGWVSGGQIAAVTGVSPDSKWWRVSCPSAQNSSCWVTAETQYTQPTTALGQPTATATTAATPTACTNAATFVADVTIPDGQQLASNTSFVKTWRVQNSGTCTWDGRYHLVHAGGSLLGAVVNKIPLPANVAPGQNIDLTVQLVSPAQTGNYQSDWKLQSPQNVLFGVGQNNSALWVKINVQTNQSTLSGFVYQDTNQNGVYNSGELLVSGREVVLAPGTACHVRQDAVATAVSGSDGRYTFKGNFTGNYCVGLVGASGALDDVVSVAVNAGQVLTDLHLRSPLVTSSISGFLWNDYCYAPESGGTPQGNCVADGLGSYHADGMIQPTETYIAGVAILLRGGSCTNNNATPVSAVTDSTGRYQFNNLSAGTYCVYMNAASAENAPILLPGDWTFPRKGIWYHELTLQTGSQAYSVNFGWDYQFR